MKHSLICLTVILGSAGAAPLAGAAVVFSQPPSPMPAGSLQSIASAPVAAPFVAPISAQMSGLCFWGTNANNGPSAVPTTFTIQLFAEAPGGGVGATLLNTSAPAASFAAESTASDFYDKYSFTLPMSQPITSGSRYFLSVSGDANSSFGWTFAPAGEPTWYSPMGAPFVPSFFTNPTAFEILGSASAIPLPPGAAMGLAGLGVMAGFRRRRAAI